jgi:pyruvate formate lyase activating enzyme
MEYIGAFAKELRRRGISCALETCGYFDYAAFKRYALPYIDCILYDIKIIDPGEHLEYTGQDNWLIMENLRLLCNDGLHIVPRTPLVPGITDTQENLSGIRALVDELGLTGRHVALPYNPASKKRQSVQLVGFDADGNEKALWNQL